MLPMRLVGINMHYVKTILLGRQVLLHILTILGRQDDVLHACPSLHLSTGVA
jgi:hypothetical protein